MNFFESQRLAKNLSKKLTYVFYLLIILISLGTATLTTLLLFGRKYNSLHSLNYINSETILTFLLINIFIAGGMLIKFLYETSKMKSDPSSICESLGAQKIKPGENTFKIKQYINVVEEMSLASSVPVPEIYLLQDNAINAFACGYDINSAAICVTTGAIKKLNRDELQSVVAHEYSHILNGDMTINLKLVGMLSTLLMIFHLGYFIFRSNRYRYKSAKPKNGGAFMLFPIVFMVLGGVGFLGGRILKSLISRQREYLADASSVQFTRNPSGMVGALKKILVNSEQGYLSSPQADKASHMYLVTGVKKWFSLGSHPPLEQRIKVIEKNFDEKRFYEHEAQEILESMHRVKETKPQKSTSTAQDLERFKDRLLNLILLYQGKNKIEQLIQNLLRKESEFSQMSGEELLKFLEKVSAWAKGQPAEQKEVVLNTLLEEVNKDKRIDFYEFLVYAYLKPVLRPIKIQEKNLSNTEFKKHSKVIISLFAYLDHNITANENDLIPQEDLSYSIVVKSIEKVRFTKPEQKQRLINQIRRVVRSNQNITERESMTFKLICHTLGVPGQKL